MAQVTAAEAAQAVPSLAQRCFGAASASASMGGAPSPGLRARWARHRGCRGGSPEAIRSNQERSEGVRPNGISKRDGCAVSGGRGDSPG